MAKKSEKESKPNGRPIALGERQVVVSNLNFSPEKAGTELVERVDLSLAILLEEEDIPKMLQTTIADPVALLWDEKGYPSLVGVESFPLELKLTGTVGLRAVHGTDDAWLYFHSATMKKCRVAPMLGKRATLTCQVRVDPTGQLEDLGAMRIDEKAYFIFDGTGASANKNKDQTELPV